MIYGPTGEAIHLTDTELQLALQAMDTYSLPWGPEEELRRRARTKLAAALEAAQRPFREVVAR